MRPPGRRRLRAEPVELDRIQVARVGAAREERVHLDEVVALAGARAGRCGRRRTRMTSRGSSRKRASFAGGSGSDGHVAEQAQLRRADLEHGDAPVCVSAAARGPRGVAGAEADDGRPAPAPGASAAGSAPSAVWMPPKGRSCGAARSPRRATQRRSRPATRPRRRRSRPPRPRTVGRRSGRAGAARAPARREGQRHERQQPRPANGRTRRRPSPKPQPTSANTTPSTSRRRSVPAEPSTVSATRPTSRLPATQPRDVGRLEDAHLAAAPAHVVLDRALQGHEREAHEHRRRAEERERAAARYRRSTTGPLPGAAQVERAPPAPQLEEPAEARRVSAGKPTSRTRTARPAYRRMQALAEQERAQRPRAADASQPMPGQRCPRRMPEEVDGEHGAEGEAGRLDRDVDQAEPEDLERERAEAARARRAASHRPNGRRSRRRRSAGACPLAPAASAVPRSSGQRAQARQRGWRRRRTKSAARMPW